MFSEPSALGLQTIYSSIVDDDLPEDGGRRVFLGDLQGCLAELESLLAEIAFDESKDVLYPLGDLVNRGPNSKGVLKLLRHLDVAL